MSTPVTLGASQCSQLNATRGFAVGRWSSRAASARVRGSIGGRVGSCSAWGTAAPCGVPVGVTGDVTALGWGTRGAVSPASDVPTRFPALTSSSSPTLKIAPRSKLMPASPARRDASRRASSRSARRQSSRVRHLSRILLVCSTKWRRCSKMVLLYASSPCGAWHSLASLHYAHHDSSGRRCAPFRTVRASAPPWAGLHALRFRTAGATHYSRTVHHERLAP